MKFEGDERCSAEVSDGFLFYPCGRRAKVARNGKAYCLIHDPVRRLEKEEKRRLEWKAKESARDARFITAERSRVIVIRKQFAEEIIAREEREYGATPRVVEIRYDDLRALADSPPLSNSPELAEDAESR